LTRYPLRASHLYGSQVILSQVHIVYGTLQEELLSFKPR